MKKLLLSLFMGLLLSGCATAPSYRVPDGLWYAESEEPDQFHYHVYVLFLDDSHLTWWRTKESHDMVMKRWAYYTHDHPGVKILTSYTREGDQLIGERRYINKGSPGLKGFTSIQTFTGRINGDTLDMKVEDNTINADGSSWPPVMVSWSLKHLVHPPGE